MAFLPNQQETEEDDTNIDVHTNGTPIRYLPLDHLYSATSPCRVSASGSSNVMSKKVKARKLYVNGFADLDGKPVLCRPPLLHVYSRRRNGRRHSSGKLSVFESWAAGDEPTPKVSVKVEICEFKGSEKDREDGNLKDGGLIKKRKSGSSELAKLGVDLSVLRNLNAPRLRDCRNHGSVNYSSNLGGIRKRKRISSENAEKITSPLPSEKRWVRLSFDDVDPNTFIGLKCKVYWPLDADWYSGRVVGYTSETNGHHVEYEDGDKEELILSNEKIKFFISYEEMQNLNLSSSVKSLNTDVSDYNEMLVLAASLDDCQEIEPGDIIWAKLTGHAMWPAVVIDESLIGNCKGLKKFSGGRSVTVQFFGTHDFARIQVKHIISFLKGLLSSFHLKCKQPRFLRSLEEAKTYLSEQKLPQRMLHSQKGINDVCDSAHEEDEESIDSGEDSANDEGTKRTLEKIRTSPYVIGDLKILSLGKIVKGSEYFQDGRFIWPEGYTAVRKFASITDPNVCALYKMEVLRDEESKTRPLFRVTLESKEQFEGFTPNACWNKVYKKIKRMETSASEGSVAENGVGTVYKSGSDMFGFSNPEVMKLIKASSKSRVSSKSSLYKSGNGKYQELPVGFRPVRVDWKDLDKCSVCHMDEEYENNLFLQCDKCRMMVHAKCYGELEPVNGVLWLCNLCRPGAPEPLPPCCLCPVIGGAMKPTTDGLWAHLACAMWIPETCLSDVKRMEPIDGISRISRDRWKLLCSICGVSYGACIQCSNNACRVAYHPLCARAAGLCVELEDEERLYLLSADDDEEEQCIRLLSFCKRHKQPSNERLVSDERIGQVTGQCADYNPPSNPSGCARCEPYNNLGRRGRKEPEALAAASLKRLFVENQPYLVGSYSPHALSSSSELSGGVVSSSFSSDLQRLRCHQLEAPNNILSIAEKYKYMRETFRKRLAFGKSRIHGFGIFAKHPHRAGDMVIEYTGELVRPPVADRREHFIYNLLVGAGTYMFRIDDERVIDATRAGSIAHLINHSCEPNCYSRVISVNGDEHIIIFAKRDIKRWEELTYDYRFFSIDEQLACYCGFSRCRGVVNDLEAEERATKLYAPRSELIDWGGE